MLRFVKLERRNPASWPGRGLAFLAFGLVCAVYVATAATLHPSVFWSPDEGAKFIQMHSRMIKSAAPHRISYGGAKADPFFAYYPAAPIYPQPLRPSGVRRHWPETFPALSLPFFKLLGPRGLYVIPLVSGVLATALAGVLARRLAAGTAVPAMLLAGWASPLYFHSALFLEHSLACALALSALCLGGAATEGSVRQRRIRGIGAAVCLAGFFAVRDEAVLLFAALGSAAVFLARRRAAMVAGLAAGMLAALVSRMDEGRMTALIGDAANALAGLRDPQLWAALPRHVLHVLVNNPEQFGVPLPPEWAVVALFGLVLCALSPVVVPQRRFVCWLVGAGLISASATHGLCLPDRYRAIHGLLLPMPSMALAWLPAPDGAGPKGPEERFLRATLSLLLILHVGATWLLRRPAGGPEWGLRYAMVAYLLAAVLGAVAIVRFVRVERGVRRAASLGLAAALLILSCGYGVRGIFELQVTKRDLSAFEREIRKANIPLLTDRWWLAAALAPTFVETEFYTLNPGTDPSLWLEQIGSRAPVFLYVSYNTPPHAVAADGFAAFLVQRRAIQEMTFSRFEVSSNSGAGARRSGRYLGD